MKKEKPKSSTTFNYDFKCPNCGSEVSIGVVREESYDVLQWKQFILGAIIGALSLCPFIILFFVYLITKFHSDFLFPPP
jgi:hypothetical protein